jgi:RNA polymerase sigma-70 factor (ECF subfamily)
MRPDGSKESATEAGSLTDERLLQFFEAGDQTAFEAIIERHEARLARIAYRIVGCMHEAEDVRHAVFVRLLQVGTQRTKLGNIGAWLTRCTVNEAITRLRHKSLEGRVIEEAAYMVQRAAETHPPDQAEADELGEKLSTVLKGLSPDARALLSLRFDENLTFPEMAELLDRPASTVKSQVSHAITRLRKLLDANR